MACPKKIIIYFMSMKIWKLVVVGCIFLSGCGHRPLDLLIPDLAPRRWEAEDVGVCLVLGGGRS